MYDLIIRNAYLRKKNGIFDIGISKDKIVEIGKKIPGIIENEIDAKECFVSPGLIDPHTHMDKCLTAEGERFPKYNNAAYAIDVADSRDGSIKAGLEYYKSATSEEIKKHVLKHAYMQIMNGTLFTRTHVDVDKVVRTKAIEATISAKEELKDLIDIQIVAFAQSGLLRDLEAERLARESIELGADLIGGLDPASLENDIEKSFDLVFKIAREYKIDVDYHIMDPSTLGIYTLKRLAEKAIENNYQKRVTCSHSWSLGDAPKEWLDDALPMFKEAGLKFVTCFTTTPYTFPARKLYDANIPLACGSDNVRDFWLIIGSGDLVQGLLIETQRLNMTSNQDMDILWDMITIAGAKVMGIEKKYGIEIGKKADLVIFNSPSPQWAIIEQAKKMYVIKNGEVIVKNGEMLPEIRKRFDFFDK